MALLARCLDLLDLDLGLLVGFLLGLLVALCVLHHVDSSEQLFSRQKWPKAYLEGGHNGAGVYGLWEKVGSYLGLKVLELALLVRTVGGYLLLSLVAGLLDSLRTNCS